MPTKRKKRASEEVTWICLACGLVQPDSYDSDCDGCHSSMMAITDRVPWLVALSKSLGSPWPARDVVRKLVEAADHLLKDHNCDTHGWEEIQRARDEAKKWLGDTG